jgi:hypothetical protein
VFGQRLCIALALLLQESRRSLDVGEEEGDRTGREWEGSGRQRSYPSFEGETRRSFAPKLNGSTTRLGVRQEGVAVKDGTRRPRTWNVDLSLLLVILILVAAGILLFWLAYSSSN